ncbi:hypothetical protein MKW98_028853 [Papaver atlanticum]|uniref:Uncharacterized protein n=1 Tax=Papaver atlanticum TaxID=357466 RepID=A0AAD4X821_9MAGN|nr:hypothetical protein MKW98_028853 [Papaver atlanticum]
MNKFTSATSNENTTTGRDVEQMSMSLLNSESLVFRGGCSEIPMRDVKYVLVVFGGLVGYPSDDIKKILWIEVCFLTSRSLTISKRDGQYRIDNQATPTMLNSLMYKLSYYRFVETDGKNYDRVRRTETGKEHFKPTTF